MKINEVEQLVGITKKNIRFYEDCGLICPERNKANSYREYTGEDVSLLLKIKLLRRLGVPIEEIKNLLEGRLTLPGCMERHRILINHERHDLEIIDELCRALAEESSGLASLPAEKYLSRLSELEKGGVRFMNVNKTDVHKKKRGARIAAAVMIVLILLWDLFIVVMGMADPMPLPAMLLMTVPETLVIVGIAIALRERIKEIEGGEEDEASDY